MAADDTGRRALVQLVLGAVAAAAAVVLVVMGALNHSLQGDVAAGQRRIANAQAAANVDNSLIRLLAKTAAETGDAQIKDLLTRNGITYQPAPAGGAAATPAADAATNPTN